MKIVKRFLEFFECVPIETVMVRDCRSCRYLEISKVHGCEGTWCIWKYPDDYSIQGKY